MSTALQSYTDDIKRSGVPVLGNILWYSVEDVTRISHEAMAKRLEDAGLGDFIPGKPRDDDAFLRVTSKIARKREPIPGTDQFENILVRKVSHSKGAIEKQIVVETVDAENHQLSYGAKVQLQYLPMGGEFTVRPMGWDEHGRAMALAREAQANFQFWKGHLHSDSLRSIVSSVIHSTNALAIRKTGGVFFVLDSHTDRIEALLRAVDGIAGVTVDPVPLIDSSNQREMLKRAFESETVGEMTKITSEIKALTTDPTAKIPKAEADRITSRIAVVKAKAAEYEELLGNALGAAGLHEESLKRALMQMQWRTAA